VDGVGRGTGWVVAQFVLMAVVLAGGLLPPAWPDGAQSALSLVGAALAVAGIGLAVWAGRTLGRALTPFPRPVPVGLVTGGPFALVRHPIYTGGLALFVGYALFTSVTALLLTLALALLWLGKIRVEERMLAHAYPAYADYCRRVRWRLVPFVV
jgi:protein-S-isoprenylcysteine O-methyltransferase Ste14